MRSRGQQYEIVPVNRREEALDVTANRMAQPARTPSGNALPSLNLSPNQNGFSSRENLMLNNSVVTESMHSYPRKRHNPLYDNSEPESTEKPNTQTDGYMFIYIILFVVTLLSVTAVCLSVYAILTRSDNSNKPKPAYVISPGDNKTLSEMALSRLEQFEQQIQSVNGELQSYKLAFSVNASEQAARYNLLANETRALAASAEQLRNDIIEVSKMDGPQGPPGVGNLTACEFKSHSSGSPASSPENMSKSIPDPPDFEAWIILGVECSTDVGTTAFLNTVANSAGYTEYRCHCSGNDGSSHSRHCIINYWRCPRIS